MPRPRNEVPSYRLHSPTGRAVVTVYDAENRPREIYLGQHGSPESRAKYARLCANLLPGCVYLGESNDATVAEVILAYWKHTESYYSRTEVDLIRDALKVLRALHGDTSAIDFGPRALRDVREAMVRKGWCRSYINRQVGRIIRAFKWAASEEIAPAFVYQSLKTLASLRAGKTQAKESAPRRPADPVAVAATVPHLPPHVRAIVEILRITGMRPNEACRMTLGQIDRSGEVWVYSPSEHKTAHRGQHRCVFLGDRAQAILTAHLGTRELGPADPIFSPAQQQAERAVAMRASRKSKVTPSQMKRKKRAKPKRTPGEWFVPEAICHAVHRACRRAGVPLWSPYQLRHLVAAELRERFSLEHVRAALGHSHASMSAHYARGADAVLAAEVAEATG